MEHPTENSLKIVSQIMETVISKFEVQGDLNQMKTSMMPIISNAIFHRENRLLETERFNTLITLARILTDEDIEKAIQALNYTLTVRKNSLSA